MQGPGGKEHSQHGTDGEQAGRSALERATDEFVFGHIDEIFPGQTTLRRDQFPRVLEIFANHLQSRGLITDEPERTDELSSVSD